jgi:small subunit ribosomal protein S1
MEHDNALTGQEAEPVKNQSVEQPTPDGSMQSLLEEQGLSLELPNQGEIRQGIIATIRENENVVLVSIGTKSEGVISGREYEQIPADEKASFFVGQEIPVYVVAPEDQNGNVVLSYVRAREEKDWEDVDNLLASGQAYPSRVIGYNKGGLIVPVGRLRGFVPASQISLLRRPSAANETPEQRYGKMVGEPMKVRVIEVDRARRRLILSERLALQETRETLKDRLLEELAEGSVRNGRVTSLADFGAFVNIDGADGLVHLSEISWERIQHPNEVLKVGQEVQVKVISVDRERKRIGLSIRQLLTDPWMQKVGHLKEGMLVEGTVTHLTKFGAFARIGEDLEGLIHVSELSEQRVTHPKDVVKEGDVLTLRIIKIDPERRRIGLSLRKVDSPAYADLDWKLALSDEVGKTQSEEEVGEEKAAGSESEVAGEVAESEAPTSEASVGEVPASESPASEVSVSEVPASEALASEALASEALASEALASEALASEAPAGEAPAGEAPTSEVSVSEVLADETPVSEAPAGEVATGE